MDAQNASESQTNLENVLQKKNKVTFFWILPHVMCVFKNRSCETVTVAKPKNGGKKKTWTVFKAQ